MSHELRTPLNGILGYAQILQRDRTCTSRQRDSLEAIVNCGDHLLALINDVLDLSKIEAGRLEVDLVPFDVYELIKGVGHIVGERAARKGLDFITDVSPEVPRGIVTDGAKLRQILVNLLGNAAKFTERGQVTLRANIDAGGSLRFDVVDTGVGMSAEELQDIFDPFKQVEAGKAAGGTGLGLAITKRLAEALGAAVDVISEKGQGSTFTVTLPFVEAPAEALAESADGDGDGRLLELADGQQCKILVADDRDTNRNVLQGMLEAAGFTTVLASDGDEALDRLRDHDDVALVLMDVRMPRVSGIEALAQIRADERLRDRKVVAVTASVFPEFRHKAIEAGFDDFLGKPFRTEDLLRILKKHLDVRFVAETAVAEDNATPCAVEGSRWGDEAVSRLALERLRAALRIKNLTAIKAVARELSSAPATAAVGDEIARLATAFDFRRLADLLNELENNDGPE
jgi:CheY-like chemotaxis protein/anti-sigma regulatory factor (Ser/Thr protein kinase)